MSLNPTQFVYGTKKQPWYMPEEPDMHHAKFYICTQTLNELSFLFSYTLRIRM